MTADDCDLMSVLTSALAPHACLRVTLVEPPWPSAKSTSPGMPDTDDMKSQSKVST